MITSPDHVDGDREENEIIGTVVMIRLGLAVVAFAACQGFLVLLQQPVVVHQAAAISSLVLIMDAVLGVVVVSFQVRMVQQYEAGVRVAAETLETALVLILISLQVGLLWLFLPPVVGLALGTLLACGLARSRFRLRLRPNRHRLRDLIIEALPVGPALLIGVLFLKLDSLVLAKLRPAHDLGIYGAAYQPIEYLFLATAVIINVLFPMIAREWAATDPARFIELYRRGTELLVIVTAFVPLVFVFVAPNVVRLAFGPAYAQSSAPLRILAFALVALTVSGWQSLVLLAGGLQRITLICNAGALAVALVVCVALVSRFGVNGAALSALISGSLVMVASNAIIRVRLGATLELAPLHPDPGRIGRYGRRAVRALEGRRAVARDLPGRRPGLRHRAAALPLPPQHPGGHRMSIEPAVSVIFPTYNRCAVVRPDDRAPGGGRLSGRSAGDPGRRQLQ